MAVAIALAMSCGSKGGGTGPTPTPQPSGGTSSVTITIANNTVSPKNVNVTRGNRVTFTNNDSQGHNMHSDPHPFHTDCPEINQVGFVAPGQSQQTGAFMTSRTCGYHDHDRDTVEGLKGTITVQ
jgi:plastocyanin